MLKKTTIFLSSKNHSVATKVSETTWHLLGIFFIFQAIFAYSGKFFSNLKSLRQVRPAGTLKKLFVYQR